MLITSSTQYEPKSKIKWPNASLQLGSIWAYAPISGENMTLRRYSAAAGQNFLELKFVQL